MILVLSFKPSLTKTIAEDNIVMKQELFILRQLVQTILPNVNYSNSDSKTSTEEPPAKSASVPLPSKKPKFSEEKNEATACTSVPINKPDDSKNMLLIGDSISHNLDKNIIEKAIGGKVKTCTAYEAGFDNVGNEAKHAAKFPAKNVKDVITKEVKKDLVDYLVIQAGSTDITNLRTGEKDIDTEVFKKEVHYAAKNLFTAAESALEHQPNLKKVVIMTLTPRYDTRMSDPRALKPILAHMFNNTLRELWLNSPAKDKVTIGLHNLECVGGTHEARYRDIRNNKYDGIHLYGPSGGKAYTISVLDILKNCDITDEREDVISGEEYFSKQLQFQYQRNKRRYRAKPNMQSLKSDSDNDIDIRPHRRDADNDIDIRPQRHWRRHLGNYQTLQYTVTTKNRFEHLNC